MKLDAEQAKSAMAKALRASIGQFKNEVGPLVEEWKKLKKHIVLELKILTVGTVAACMAVVISLLKILSCGEFSWKVPISLLWVFLSLYCIRAIVRELRVLWTTLSMGEMMAGMQAAVSHMEKTIEDD